MTFRYARHSNDLESLRLFYHEILGLEVIGEFSDHEGYDGLFFGIPEADWHLEFTKTEELVDRKPDLDDLLVFYVESEDKMIDIEGKAKEKGFFSQKSKNPYWRRNGIELRDPDGFGVIITVKIRWSSTSLGF